MRSVSDGSVSTLQGNSTPDEDGSGGEKSEPLLRVELELQSKSDRNLIVSVGHLHYALCAYYVPSFMNICIISRIASVHIGCV